MFDIPVYLPALIISCVSGVLAAVAARIFFFMLDGTRTEYLEYEDEEYCYFVKAIPKVSVTVSEKRITRITGKADDEGEEEFLEEPGMSGKDGLFEHNG